MVSIIIATSLYISLHYILTSNVELFEAEWRIGVSQLAKIASDNDLSPRWHQAIILTNSIIFSIGRLGTNFSGILI